MKIVIALSVIVVSFVLGVVTTNFAAMHSANKFLLAKSASDVDLYTRLLDGLRSNQEELMKDRLESLLDHSIIDVAHEYSANLDIDSHAAKALALAKSYRATHPHRNQMDDVAKQVDAALATAPKP
jgi:predicted sugar kinase